MGLLSHHEDAARPNGKGLSGDFQNFIHDVERVMKDLQGLTGSGLSSARSELESQVAKARASLADASRQAMDRATHTKEAVGEYVTTRPVTSLLVAIAAGALIAYAISRIGSSSNRNEPFRWE